MQKTKAKNNKGGKAVFLLENRSRGGGIVARRGKGGRHE